MKQTDAKTALNTMCHTYERTFTGTIYTISDRRYPEYNGCQILVTLKNGQNDAQWMED